MGLDQGHTDAEAWAPKFAIAEPCLSSPQLVMASGAARSVLREACCAFM